ncbi:MAG: hypothetical protein ACSLE6_09925, partial [Mycobacterium sp.]
MPLPSFTVTPRKLLEILGDLVSSELAATPLTSRAAVEFVPNVTNYEKSFFVWENNFHRVLPVKAVVDIDGFIVADGGAPVTLLANDAALPFTGLQWQLNVRIERHTIKLANFIAPGDGEALDLATVAPVPNAPVQGMIAGPPGPPGPPGGDIPVLHFDGVTGWPARPGGADLVIWVGGDVPDDAPPGEDSDIWFEGSAGVVLLDDLGFSAVGQLLVVAATEAAARSAVGLGSVDNTADSAKPVSTAQQTALDLKAPLASPAFTGTPTGIT